MKHLNILAFLLAFSGLAAAHADAPNVPYTKAQATNGATLFSQNCAMCHGTPASDWAFSAAKLAPMSVGQVFTTMTTAMPRNNPSSLSHAQYEDIMAYILQNNGYPAGAQPLVYNQTLKNQSQIRSNTKQNPKK